MKQQKEKQKNAGYALENIKPITPVAVIQSIRSRFRRNKNTVNRMKKKRQENAENLDEQQIRKVMNVGDGIVKNFIAAHCLWIGEHMHEKVYAQRHDAR